MNEYNKLPKHKPDYKNPGYAVYSTEWVYDDDYKYHVYDTSTGLRVKFATDSNRHDEQPTNNALVNAILWADRAYYR